MPRVANRTLIETAMSQRRSIAAFNVITLEHAEGICQGAERAGLPVILQLSENAIAYHGTPRAIAAAMVAVAEESSASVALHLDHITDVELLHLAPELGFSSAMFDGSTLPYEQNVAVTRAAVEWGRREGIWIEAEIGEIGGKDGAHAPGVRTRPDEAHQFQDATGVDALAVAVGSSHAMATKDAQLDLGLIAEIRDAVPAPLVLHGSSGVPDDQITAAARAGIVKVNIGTALNLAFTGTVRDYLSAHPAAVDPRKPLASARDAVADCVAHYLAVVAGSAAR